jgi:hypothetical protein
LAALALLLLALLHGRGLDAPSFRDGVIGGYLRGGQDAYSRLPARIRTAAPAFDSVNERAVEYLRRYSASLISGITAAQRQTIQQTLIFGFRQGWTQAQMASAIVDGIGLTTPMSIALQNFRRTLEEGRAFGAFPTDRKLSDIDRMLALRIMRDGGTQAQIAAMVERYRRQLLNVRATAIARTESVRAYNAGQVEMWRQLRDSGAIDPGVSRKFWNYVHDDRVRDAHIDVSEMNQDGVPLDAPFAHNIPGWDGQHPPSAVNCRCWLTLDAEGAQVNADAA